MVSANGYTLKSLPWVFFKHALLYAIAQRLPLADHEVPGFA